MSETLKRSSSALNILAGTKLTLGALENQRLAYHWRKEIHSAAKSMNPPRPPVRSGKEELIMENVDILRPQGEQVYIRDIFGEQLWLRAYIKEMNLVEHRILLAENTAPGIVPWSA